MISPRPLPRLRNCTRLGFIATPPETSPSPPARSGPSPDPVYFQYWQRKKLSATPPAFPVVRWWPEAGLSEAERAWIPAILDRGSLLDIGAGDLSVRQKILAAGFRGRYDTLDIGDEHAYTYRDLSQVPGSYGAILCIDVLEHLELKTGLGLLHRIRSLLEPGGVLVIQTPNSRCVRTAQAKDMTHVHSYNLPDLHAYLSCLGFQARGYRVAYSAPGPGPGRWLLEKLGALVTTRLLGCDYADNILLVGHRGP
jgi:hypothetical protein